MQRKRWLEAKNDSASVRKLLLTSAHANIINQLPPRPVPPVMGKGGLGAGAENPFEGDAPSAWTWGDTGVDIVNMLKAFIGLNFMYVAYAFSKAGIVRGIVGLLVIAGVTEHCCLMLVSVKREMMRENAAGIREDRVTYGDIARYSLGEHGERIVNFALILTQFGYCVGYLIFIAQTLHDMFGAQGSVWGWVVLPVPVLCGIAMLGSIRSLGPFSLLANAALLVGFVAVVGFIGRHFHWAPPHPHLSSFPLFFGQMTAALEGIGLVIPVESSMRNRAHFPMVLRIALVVLTGVLMSVGVLGSARFGDETRSILLLNFGNSPVVNVVKAVLVCGILFTYPLQIVPVFQFVETWLFKSTSTTSSPASELDTLDALPSESEAQSEAQSEPTSEAESQEPGFIFSDPASADLEDSGSLQEPWTSRSLFIGDPRQIIARITIVLATALVAMLAGASFGLFQALVGSLGASVLAYSAPAFMHVRAFGAQSSQAVRMKDWTIFVFGVTGAIVGTGTTLYEISLIHAGQAKPL